MATVPALATLQPRPIPDYRVVTNHKPAPGGMPGRYPGRVVTVHSPQCIDEATEKVDVPTVQTMIARGMSTLTGDKDPRDSWARFFNARGLRRHQDQLLRRAGRDVHARGRRRDHAQPDRRRREAHEHRDSRARRRPDPARPHYERFVPAGVRVESANTWLGYDPDVYVEANFFGEDDTRSYLIRMVTDQFTKIINVPNMKDHGASGVTGCLKNIAYGEFNNVARSHYQRADGDADLHRHARTRRAAPIANRPQHHGRPARRLARRPVLDETGGIASIRSR